jgi:hypothetical protein
MPNEDIFLPNRLITGNCLGSTPLKYDLIYIFIYSYDKSGLEEWKGVYWHT